MRSSIVVGVVVGVASGCFHPTPPAGAPCSERGTCPSDLVCATQLSPPLCVDPLDAAAINDAGKDGSALTCNADAECPSQVCHELLSRCVDESAALYVASTGDGGVCSRGAPCRTIQDAIIASSLARHTIALATGSYDGFDLADAATQPLILSGPTRQPAGTTITTTLFQNTVGSTSEVLVEGVAIDRGVATHGFDASGTLTLSHVTIDGARGSGIRSKGTLRVFDSTVTNCTETGILATDGSVEVQRTIVAGNDETGITVEGAGFTIINTFITGNGATLQPTMGARLRAPLGTSAVFRYNTVARNLGSANPSGTNGVTCQSSVTVANSILVAGTGGFGSTNPMVGCTATQSLFATNAPAGNFVGDPMFASATDAHILPGSAAIDRAGPSDPELLDIDGQVRTGTPDVGADELP